MSVMKLRLTRSTDNEAPCLGGASLLGLGVALLLVPACGSPPPPTSKAVAPVSSVAVRAAPPSRTVYRVEDVGAAGLISGRIKLRAQVAPPSRVAPDHDLECCVQPLEDETLRRSPSGGVAGAVVYLTGIEAGKRWAGDTPELDNAQCRFDPHILVVRAGSPITVKNTDGCVHNVNTFARRNPPTNATLPPPATGGRPVTRTFVVPEEVKVVCDSHKWMSAWIVVRDNPYFAVSDADGRFRIADVPPGRHRATVWHERLGRFEAEVEVPPTGEARLDHTFDTVQP